MSSFGRAAALQHRQRGSAAPATQQRAAAPHAAGRRHSVRVLAAAAKHALITGGNTGIGFETAKALASKGFSVTLACRDAAKAAAAVAAVQAAAPGAAVDSLALDLASLQQVRDAAAAYLDRGRRTDVLLLNAGVMAPPRMTTKDGFELQLGVNHLGHALLTSLLLPQLQQDAQSGPVRVVSVSSAAHLFGRINFDDLNSERYDRWTAYGQSKLANVLFAYELARRLPPDSNITVNALHPGVVRTELPRYLVTDPDSWSAKLLTLLSTPFTLSPEEGARTSIHLASSPDAEGVTGKYWDACKPVPSSPLSYDTGVAARLWQVTEELTNAKAGAAAVL